MRCRPTTCSPIEVTPDGKARFALPRQEVGQGITTSFAQVIADELDMPIENVKVYLSDARPELVWNQLTGGSTSHFSLWSPVKMMAATARTALATAAAEKWNVPVVLGHDPRRRRASARTGRRATYGSLSELAASKVTKPLDVKLKSKPGKYVGQSIGRVDAHDMVTGAKKFAMDLPIANALPTMVCRPPTLNGTVQSVENLEQVKAMPGVTDVGAISRGVAVRARTFGQCIDAIRALRVTWGAGTVDKENNDSLTAKVAVRPAPDGAGVPGRRGHRGGLHLPLPQRLAAGDQLRDRRRAAATRAEVWGANKMPIITLQRIALHAGHARGERHRALPDRRWLLRPAPVLGRRPTRPSRPRSCSASRCKLMWHRTDDARHGRMHPMMVNRGAGHQARATASPASRMSQRLARPATGPTASARSSPARRPPRTRVSASPATRRWATSRCPWASTRWSPAVPYNFGPTAVYLNEIFAYDTLPTSAVRNVYSPGHRHRP